MPPQARLGDKALIPADAHGCPACPHTATGPAIAGSPNVFVNGRPAIRVNDPGIHAACCGPNLWNAKTGSRSVFINGRSAHRLGDLVKHCGGMGSTIEGSSNVIVGDRAGQGSYKTKIRSTKHKILARAIFHDETPLANEVYKIIQNGAVIRSGKTNSQGWINEPNIPEGDYEIEIGNNWIVEE